MRETMEIRVRVACRNCKGEGAFNRPGCGKCANFFDSEIKPGDRLLPCGHHRDEYVDEWTCLDCMGTGKVETWITVEEWIERVDNIRRSQG